MRKQSVAVGELNNRFQRLLGGELGLLNEEALAYSGPTSKCGIRDDSEVPKLVKECGPTFLHRENFPRGSSAISFCQPDLMCHCQDPLR